MSFRPLAGWRGRLEGLDRVPHLLTSLALAILAQGVLTPKPTLEVIALFTLAIIFLLLPAKGLSRIKWGLFPLPLLMLGVWLRTFPHLMDQLPRLQRYYPQATLRSFTRPSGELRFVALEVRREEIQEVQERYLPGGASPTY